MNKNIIVKIKKLLWKWGVLTRYAFDTISFSFPYFSDPFVHPSVPQCFLSLRVRADGKGARCLMPGGQAIEGKGGKKEMTDGWRERGRKEKPKCTPAVMAQRNSLLRPVIRQRWPFPELPLEKSCGFFRIFDLALQWTAEKSPDVFPRLSLFSSFNFFS